MSDAAFAGFFGNEEEINKIRQAFGRLSNEAFWRAILEIIKGKDKQDEIIREKLRDEILGHINQFLANDKSRDNIVLFMDFNKVEGTFKDFVHAIDTKFNILSYQIETTINTVQKELEKEGDAFNQERSRREKILKRLDEISKQRSNYLTHQIKI